MITFEKSGLKPEIIRAVADLGFNQPTPIQAEILPKLDFPPTALIALAQTGTGKTAGFGLPLIHHLDAANKNTQALILCPTRELCLQITNDFEDFMKYLPKLHVSAIYGGAPIFSQQRQLQKGSQIVVGTPGRVIDMINRGALDISKINWFILDEADEMLNMGFKDELETIFDQTPEEKITWLFSATMPPRVESISRKYLNNAERISVGKRNEGAINVSHEYYLVAPRDRFEALRRIVANYDNFYGVIFCRTRQETTDVTSKLNAHGFAAEALSGALSQQQRDQVMQKFRKRQLKILVATDVAARGIDIDDLTHVINFQLPDDSEVYVHRSGRTGRAGKSGISVSIVNEKQRYKIKELEKMIGKKFELKKVPTMEEIGRKKVLQIVDEVKDINLKDKNIASVLTDVFLQMEDLSREEIIEKFTKWAFTQAMDGEVEMADINVTKRELEREERRSRDFDGRDRGGRQRSGGNKSFTRVDFNIGSDEKINPARLMGIINEVMNDSSINFGKIEVDRKSSAIDIDSDHAMDVAMAMEGMRYGHKQIEVELSNKPLGRVGRPPKPSSRRRASFDESKALRSKRSSKSGKSKPGAKRRKR